METQLTLLKIVIASAAIIALMGSASSEETTKIQDGLVFSNSSGGTVTVEYKRPPSHFDVSLTYDGQQIVAPGFELGDDGLYYGFGVNSKNVVCHLHIEISSMKVGATFDDVCIERFGLAFISDKWTITQIFRNGQSVSEFKQAPSPK